MPPRFILCIIAFASRVVIENKFVNKAMDEVRKKERKGNELIKNHKYTFLRLNKNLSKEKSSGLDYINMLYPHLGEAYRLKEMFLDVFQIQDSDQAKGYMRFWCDLAIESKIQPFIKFANLVKAYLVWNSKLF
jgi:transposase